MKNEGTFTFLSQQIKRAFVHDEAYDAANLNVFRWRIILLHSASLDQTGFHQISALVLMATTTRAFVEHGLFRPQQHTLLTLFTRRRTAAAQSRAAFSTSSRYRLNEFCSISWIWQNNSSPRCQGCKKFATTNPSTVEQESDIVARWWLYLWHKICKKRNHGIEGHVKSVSRHASWVPWLLTTEEENLAGCHFPDGAVWYSQYVSSVISSSVHMHSSPGSGFPWVSDILHLFQKGGENGLIFRINAEAVWESRDFAALATGSSASY